MSIPSGVRHYTREEERALFRTFTDETLDRFLGSYDCSSRQDVWILVLLFTRMAFMQSVYNRERITELLNSSSDSRISIYTNWQWEDYAPYYDRAIHNTLHSEYLVNLSTFMSGVVSEGILPNVSQANIPNIELTPAQEVLGRRGRSRSESSQTEAHNLSIMYSDTFAKHKKKGLIYIRSFSMTDSDKVSMKYHASSDVDQTPKRMNFVEDDFERLACPELGFIHVPKYKSLFYISRRVGGYKRGYAPERMKLYALPVHVEVPSATYNVDVLQATFDPDYKSFEENVSLKRLKFPLSKSLAFIKIKKRSEYAVLYHTSVVGVYKKDQFHLQPEYESLNNIIQEEFENAFR